MVDVTTAFKNECEANVGTYKFGKVEVNLIDNNPASWEIGEYSSSNGTKIDTANMTRLSSLSKCEPNKQYTVSLNNSNFRLRLAYFNDSQTYISSSATLTGGTITTPANTKYIGATLWNNANTYTGTNINLQNSTNDKLVSYNLEGQTTQSGTPTPDAPVEVQTVRGKNIARNFSVNSNTAAYATVLFIDADLMPSTTYTISFKGTYNNRLYANETLFTTSPYFYISEGRTTVTITTKDTISKTNTSQTETPIGMWQIFKNAQAQSSANVFEDVQIEQGSIATSYLPYDTIQAQVAGKNLCKITSVVPQIYSNGLPAGTTQLITVDNFDNNNITFHSTGTGYIMVLTNVMQLLPNTQYTVKFGKQTTSTNNQFFIYNYSNGTYTINYRDNNTNVLQKTFTTSSTGQVAFAFGHGQTTGNTEISNMQLEQGTTATTYEAHKEKTYSITLGKSNLFDKASTPYKANYYINGSGTEYDNGEFSIYKQSVKPNTKYTIWNSGQSGGPRLRFI